MCLFFTVDKQNSFKVLFRYLIHMSDIIEERDVNSKNSYLSKSTDSLLNLQYMDEKAITNAYTNKYLNDDIDNQINDFKNKEKIINILNAIIQLSNKNINEINIYDIGFYAGQLYERLPNYFINIINSIRTNLLKKNFKHIIQSCGDINNILHQ